MLSGRRFQFRPVLTLFAAIGLGVLISLGNWQLDRLQWKRDLIARVDARIDAPPIDFANARAGERAGEDLEYTPIIMEGVYAPEFEIQVFGAIKGAPGIFVFTPLRLDDGSFVYVNRGFVPQGLAKNKNFSAVNDGRVAVTGLFRAPSKPSPPASWFQPKAQSVDGLWHVRDPSLFAGAANINAAPFYLDKTAGAPQEIPTGGTTRIDFRNKHMEYALTWFGLAATLFGVWLVFSLPNCAQSNNFKK